MQTKRMLFAIPIVLGAAIFLAGAEVSTMFILLGNQFEKNVTLSIESPVMDFYAKCKIPITVEISNYSNKPLRITRRPLSSRTDIKEVKDGPRKARVMFGCGTSAKKSPLHVVSIPAYSTFKYITYVNPIATPGLYKIRLRNTYSSSGIEHVEGLWTGDIYSNEILLVIKKPISELNKSTQATPNGASAEKNMKSRYVEKYSFSGAGRNTILHITVKNSTDKRHRISKNLSSSSQYGLKFYDSKGKPVPTIPPPFPIDGYTDIQPGKEIELTYHLNVFSPALKPGTYRIVIPFLDNESIIWELTE